MYLTIIFTLALSLIVISNDIIVYIIIGGGTGGFTSAIIQDWIRNINYIKIDENFN
jgi:hypothetical protein